MDQSIALTAMSWLKNVSSTFKDLLFASSRAGTPTPESASSFPQFSRLPVELRFRIWRFALVPRTLCIHLHDYIPDWLEAEDRYEGYATDEPAEVNLLEHFNSPGPDGRFRPTHMVITPCIKAHPCRCDSYPPNSKGSVPLPAVLLVCQESREACIVLYKRCLDDEYGTHGDPVRHPISCIERIPASTPPVTGLVMNFSIDSIYFKVNVARGSSLRDVHHLAAIAAKHTPKIRKVIVRLEIAMPPFMFGSSARWQYWRKWGMHEWWVPVKFLVQMLHLEKVVLLRRLDKMLPPEWALRTSSQWEEELNKSRDLWPVEWDGKMPTLRFAETLESA